MFMKSVRSAAATLVMSAMAFGGAVQPAKADTTSTLIITAAAAIGLMTAINVAQKNAKARQLVGYLPDGSQVYADGHVVARNGQTWYPGNYGQNIACNGQQCYVSGGNIGYGQAPYGYGQGQAPYSYGQGQAPYGYGSGGYYGNSYPAGYSNGYPTGYNNGGYYGNRYPAGYSNGYPAGYNNGGYYGRTYPSGYYGNAAGGRVAPLSSTSVADPNAHPHQAGRVNRPGAHSGPIRVEKQQPPAQR
jgi:hypothetical protein